VNSLCNFFYLCVLIAGVSVYLFTGSSAPLQYLPLSARASCEPDADFRHRYYIYLYDGTFTCMMLSHRCGVCSQVESFLCSTAASARRHITCPVSVRASCDMVLILDTDYLYDAPTGVSVYLLTGGVVPLLHCSVCPASYHVSCLPPSSRASSLPGTSWLCPRCKDGCKPLYGDIVWVKYSNYRLVMCHRSTQPCIPPGSLNRVPASSGVRAGMSPLPAV